MLHGPKIFSVYFGRHILNFLLLHIKVLRKQPDPFWNSWLLPQRAAPHALTNFRCVRNATHRCEPASTREPRAVKTLLKRPLDGQYFCTIFEIAQWHWTFVGTIERLCNIIDDIKTFWNILRNLKILCRLWVVLCNIPSILLFRSCAFQ